MGRVRIGLGIAIAIGAWAWDWYWSCLSWTWGADERRFVSGILRLPFRTLYFKSFLGYVKIIKTNVYGIGR